MCPPQPFLKLQGLRDPVHTSSTVNILELKYDSYTDTPTDFYNKYRRINELIHWKNEAEKMTPLMEDTGMVELTGVKRGNQYPSGSETRRSNQP